MNELITAYFDWNVSIINTISSAPIYGVLFLLPVLSLVIVVVKRSYK